MGNILYGLAVGKTLATNTKEPKLGNSSHDDGDDVHPEQLVGQDTEKQINENEKGTISRNSDLTNIELLQSEIKYWKHKSIFLQKMIDDDKHLYLTLGTTQLVQSAAEVDGCCNCKNAFNNQSYCILPDLAIQEILANIKDQSTLLTCRLVCVKWNQFVKNTPQLMARIKFPIWHVKLFLELGIVKQGKVKSIIIKNFTPLDSNYKNAFLNSICQKNSIEKVEFAFEATSLSEDLAFLQQEQLFKLVLENCYKLQEITWTKMKLYAYFAADIQIPVHNVINTVSMQIGCSSTYYQEEDSAKANALAKFLLKLPKLKRVKLIRYGNEGDVVIMQGLNKYIIKSADSTVKLKELSLKFQPLQFQEYEVFFKLVLLCDQHQILLKEFPEINLNYLLTPASAAAMPSLAIAQLQGGRCPIFHTKLKGYLTIEGYKLESLERLNNCLNICELTIFIKREILNGELSNWIQYTESIDSLVLNNVIQPEGTKLGPQSLGEFGIAFSAGIPSLKTLHIENDISDSINVFQFHWSQYFPNLTKIEINHCQGRTDNLISDLTNLQFLTHLEFTQLPNLLDNDFTEDCVYKYCESGSNLSMAPAITCFKSLKYLGLYWCQGITNICIVNGISKSKTLDMLDVIHCEGITKKCKDLCKFKISFT